MPAPVVLPMAENMCSAATYAEKINQVTENKLQITKDLLDFQQNITVAKMNKEMYDLKGELVQMKKNSTKRTGKKEPGRNSPQAKQTKVTLYKDCVFEVKQDDSSSESDSVEPKRKSKSSEHTMAKRSENERIHNLHRRYAAKVNDVKLNSFDLLVKSTKRQS